MSRLLPRLAQINLNLVVVLEVLLEECSVSGAARRLGVSQSAVSQSLGQLREALDDPILVRAGRTMVRTPKADVLAAGLGAALGELQRVLYETQAFEPATFERRFVVGSNTEMAWLIGSNLYARLQALAPRVEVVFERTSGAIEAKLTSGVLDFAIEGELDDRRGLGRHPLRPESFVTLLREGHPCAPAAGEALTPEVWLSIPHLVVGQAHPRRDVIDGLLGAHGLERTVGMRVSSVLSCGAIVEETDMCWSTIGAVAYRMMERHRLVAYDLPLPQPSLPPGFVYWHERWSRDPGHAFMRGLLAECLEDLQGKSAR